MPALTRAWQMLLKGLIEVRDATRPIAACEMALIRLAYAADLPPTDKLGARPARRRRAAAPGRCVPARALGRRAARERADRAVHAGSLCAGHGGGVCAVAAQHRGHGRARRSQIGVEGADRELRPPDPARAGHPRLLARAGRASVARRRPDPEAQGLDRPALDGDAGARGRRALHRRAPQIGQGGADGKRDAGAAGARRAGPLPRAPRSSRCARRRPTRSPSRRCRTRTPSGWRRMLPVPRSSA